jgi:hypothetical protein
MSIGVMMMVMFMVSVIVVVGMFMSMIVTVVNMIMFLIRLFSRNGVFNLVSV